MATIRRRNNKWQVQIRHAGHAPVSRTFTNKGDATTWANTQEHLYHTGDLRPRDRTGRTLNDVLDRYEQDVIPMKRADSTETFMLRVLRRHEMSTKLLTHLKAQDIAKFRDERLLVAKPSTVVRHLSVLRHALKVAHTEWGWSCPVQEVEKVRFPSVPIGATDRLSEFDIQNVLAAAQTQSNASVPTAIMLALGTGMRRGELLSLKWKDVDLSRCSITIRTSKNGRARTIPITREIAELLRSLPHDSEFVLSLTANCLKLAFARARKRAGVTFRFHDLRHEAISRFFEVGLTIPEVQLISGHRTLSQLGRYSHPDVARVAAKLAC